jgi:hypothetical protein
MEGVQRLEAHFVPDDDGPAPWEEWEYLRLCINPLGFLELKDWQDLQHTSLLDDDGCSTAMITAGIENILHLGGPHHPFLGLELDEFRILKRNGHLFTIEMDGAVHPPSGDKEPGMPTGDFRLLDEVPFASVSVAVPLNAADPLAAAKGIAQRELGVKGFARTKVKLYDPNRPEGRRRPAVHHNVTLEVMATGT